MSAIFEHFKPPPLASDPPAKTKFWPAPPTPSSGGILQRPKITSNISASSSSSQLSAPSNPPLPLSPSSSNRVSFAPLPDVAERKRRNSITLGVAARSAALRQMKERSAGAPQPPPGAGPRSAHPQSRAGGRPGRPHYTYQHYQAGQPRPRRPASRDDDVVDLGEVAMDAGKKLWRVINKKTRKSTAASDSGRLDVGSEPSVGGPTVGVSGHNTEREILVRGFAVPEDIPDEEEEERERDEEEEREQVYRTEDYVADMQALRVYDDPDPSEAFAVDPSAVSSAGSNGADSLSPGHIHSTTHSPPPRTPESEVSELSSGASSPPASDTTLNPDSRLPDGDLGSPPEKNSLF
ncbi:hypothetical protein FRC06_002135 [Ceratobasidium sp. 370]|nr:hypothetical protein FRC06_002135 [Ceratobasidium sp. 370]